jgi:hypothetical protein
VCPESEIKLHQAQVQTHGGCCGPETRGLLAGWLVCAMCCMRRNSHTAFVICARGEHFYSLSVTVGGPNHIVGIRVIRLKAQAGQRVTYYTTAQKHHDAAQLAQLKSPSPPNRF